MSLYREAALKGRGGGFSNPIVIRGNLPASLTLLGLLAVVLAFAIFGYTHSYIRRATVPGYLSPAAGAVSIVSPASGRLTVLTTNGAEAKRDQLIATVTTGELSAAGVSSTDVEISTLERRRALIAEQMDLIRSRLDTLEDQRERSLLLQTKKIELAEVQIELARSEQKLLEEETARQEALARRGLRSAPEMMDLRQAALSGQQRLVEAESRLDVLKAEVEQLDLDWTTQGIELRQALSSLQREDDTAASEINRLKSLRIGGVFAPIDGIVSVTRAQNDEQVSAGQSLFSIEPAGAELVGVLLAPSSAIGFVKEGDIVQIRYTAFPYREHGIFDGRVLEIDRTARLPSEIDAPVALEEPVYRVRVAVAQSPESKTGETLRLSSGMLFEASIVIDEKPLLFWILDPIL